MVAAEPVSIYLHSLFTDQLQPLQVIPVCGDKQMLSHCTFLSFLHLCQGVRVNEGEQRIEHLWLHIFYAYGVGGVLSYIGT